MFTKITATLTVLFTLTAAQLPPTLIISVIDVTTGTTLGTLNGYGNFSSPGPSYPFRAIATTGDFSDLYGFQECSADGILVCYGDDSAAPGSFFETVDGNLALKGTDGTWSVNATTDASGGVTPVGLPYGIPVYVGDVAAIPVTLSVRAASG